MLKPMIHNRVRALSLTARFVREVHDAVLSLRIALAIKRRVPMATDLPAHLKRDIGLER